ncbi:hypothetical protein MG290_01985 [Flavobacterium sp. CBA20B-1]|uniref:hypothetical protein n=1 Tax=unclassified Flavobacterium TaxID=196869 RepID=UPI0022248A13|nr:MULTISPECIES: hypothetical protein [unclassified Flavobacterium]WCM42464.1 hypothetical protein MG290_01985 [Flavobacterium sp. CBA20B-1]
MRDYLQTPIYKKAEEIFDTIKTITDLFSTDDEILLDLKAQLLGDAMLIQAKLAGAFGAKLYDIKMENAALIRKAARDLMVSYHSLKMFGFEDVEYYKIVRNQIEEFRLLFVEWVAGFNKKHFITDSWGLFNPPGIAHDYEQRSDELDFLGEED